MDYIHITDVSGCRQVTVPPWNTLWWTAVDQTCRCQRCRW